MIFENLLYEDLKDIVPIYIDAFNREPWNDKWTIETASKRLKDMINTPGYYGLKVYENEKIIGAIIGHREQYYDGIYFSIKEFFMDNNMQGKGYGSKILKQLENNLKDMNITTINILTTNSPLTVGFYEKNNFNIDSMKFMIKKL